MNCPHEQITLRKTAQRAVLGKCPCCGKGKLFARYLRQVDACPSCGECFAGLRADDAAPWLTIIVVGHMFLPMALMIDLGFLPVWMVATGWSFFFAVLSVVLLPRAKGLVLAILWLTRATAEPTIVS